MVKRQIRTAILLIFLCSAFSFLPNSFTPVKAGSGSFNENFSTTTYMDVVNTNATGWGAGVVKSPYRDTIELRSIFNNSNDPVDVFVEDNYAYVADYHGDLSIYDVSDPSNIISVSNYTIGSGAGTPTGVFVSDSVCYVTTRHWGLQIVNVSAPASPGNITAYYTIDHPTDVFVEGDYCYIADDDGGVQIVDISTPSSPTNASAIDVGGRGYGVYVDDSKLYVAEYYGKFLVYDVTDPSDPYHLGNDTRSGNPNDLSVYGNVAYLANGFGGFYTMDVSNPAVPTMLDNYVTGNHIKDAKYRDGLVYVTDAELGVLALDVSVPDNITLVASYDTFNWPDGLFVKDGIVYVTDYMGGFLILDHSGYKTPTFAQSTTIASISDDAHFLSASILLDGYSTLWSGMAIGLYLSADGGLNWESVVHGVDTPFINLGKDLRFRLILVCFNPINATWVSEINISYSTQLYYVYKDTPPNYGGSDNSTTTLTWDPLVGAESYLLQVDNNTLWPSLEINATVAGGLTEFTTPALPDGSYYWRIAGIDSEGDLGKWSSTWIFSIDTTAPVVTGPDDFSYTEGDTGNNITFVYSDPNPSSFAIYLDNVMLGLEDITVGSDHFNVSADGLSVGTHNFTCVVFDVAHGAGKDTVLVTVNPVVKEYTQIIIVLPMLAVVGIAIVYLVKRRK